MIEYKPFFEEKFKNEVIEAIKTNNYILVDVTRERDEDISKIIVEGRIKTKSYGGVDFLFITSCTGGRFL